jgi:tryptophan synthase alpha chain
LNGIEHVAERFKRVGARNEAALIPYFVAGYPTLRATRELLWQAYEAGASLVELGIPFSDPVADGPSIQRASHAALKNGTTPKKALALVSEIRREGFDLPVIGMTYANLVFQNGFPAAARAWSRAGLDGAIIPDISLEDSGPFRKAWSKEGIATTFFVAPSTRRERIANALRASSGFVYLVAVYGTTGARKEVDPATLDLLRRTRAERGTSKKPPLCVGFGISKPSHVRTLRDAGANGLIVGSALLERIDAGRPVRAYLKSLKRATLSLD